VSYPAHLVIRIDTTDQEFQATVQTLATFQPLGGERRVVHVCHDPAEQVRFDCPIQIRNVLAKVQVGDGVRMALATPAIFEHGWRPAWLAPNEAGHLVGTPPEAPDTLRLELVSVSNQRWDAVSGWSYEEPRGPKPVKRMVPAGGVYFFRVKQGDASVLTDRWLQPVSDDAQDRRDGFGLAMWGVWEKH
jgi:CRISPR-associated protein Cmr3